MWGHHNDRDVFVVNSTAGFYICTIIFCLSQNAIEQFQTIMSIFFLENKIDGKALLCTKNAFSMFQCAFPGVPNGYLFRIFEAFHKAYEQDVCDKDHGQDVCDKDHEQDVTAASDDTESLNESLNLSSSGPSSSDSNYSSSSYEVPPLTRPLPKQFPLFKCQFGFSGKEMIRTGLITSAGKREITMELVRVMKCYERYV